MFTAIASIIAVVLTLGLGFSVLGWKDFGFTRLRLLGVLVCGIPLLAVILLTVLAAIMILLGHGNEPVPFLSGG